MQSSVLKLNTKTDGKKIISYRESASKYSNSSEFNLQREGDTDGNNYNRSNLCVIRMKYKDIQFKGTTKVKNAEDVAQTVSLLRNKVEEHALAIHIAQKWHI